MRERGEAGPVYGLRCEFKYITVCTTRGWAGAGLSEYRPQLGDPIFLMSIVKSNKGKLREEKSQLISAP